MPVLIIGGEGKPEKKSMAMPSKKTFGGIGGKYMSEDSGSEMESESSSTDTRKIEAARLLLRAIEKNNPTLVAEAISTLVECCSDAGDGAGESEGDDLGETD
jgi:hypothetical protein